MESINKRYSWRRRPDGRLRRSYPCGGPWVEIVPIPGVTPVVYSVRGGRRPDGVDFATHARPRRSAMLTGSHRFRAMVEAHRARGGASC